MATKISLVYDFEELCGVFSSLALAKKAVAEHLSYIKKYTSEKSERLGFGDVEFEVFEDEGHVRFYSTIRDLIAEILRAPSFDDLVLD